MLRSTATSLPPRATRWLAAWLAVMVWALGVLAVSPDLHRALHHDHDDHHDEPTHQCAVTLFAHGVDTLGAPPTLEPLADARELGCVAAPRTHVWAQPRYFHRPACGPPVC